MSFLRKGIFFSGGQMVGIVLTLFMQILYSRVLGVEGVGQWRLFDTVTMIGGTLAVAGLSLAAVYFINNLKHSINQVTTMSLYFGLASGAVTALVVFGLLLLMPGYFGKVSLPVIVLFSLSVAIFPTSIMLYQVMIAEMKVVWLVLLQLSKTLIAIVGGLILAALHRLTVENAILIGVAASFAYTIMVVVYQRRHINLALRFDWRLFRRMLAYGVKLAGAGVLLLVSMEVSIVLLRTRMPGEFTPVGLYSRATTICGFAVILPRLMAPLLYSQWSGVAGEQRARQLEMALRVSVLYSLVVTAALMAAGEYVIWLMYGREFIPALPTLRILAPATVFTSIFLVAHNAIIGDGRGGLMNWILGGTVLVMFPAIWLLIPRLGVAGAAVGTLCGNMFLGIVTLATCRKLFGIRIWHCFWPTRDDMGRIMHAVLSRGRQPQTAVTVGPQVPMEEECHG